MELPQNAFKRALEALKPGDPADPETTVQPMITASHWDHVQGYIRKGLEEGAELVTGGLGKPKDLESGNFVKPTVIAWAAPFSASASANSHRVPAIIVAPYSDRRARRRSVRI